MKPAFEVFINVRKPVEEVFDAVYNPDKLRRYFTSAGASAPMDAGSTVMWEFADFPGPFPARIKECVKNARLAFEWEPQEESQWNLVEMDFDAIDAATTKVRIRERGWSETPQGLKLSYGNCMGWAQMLCCLKAWLEYGINLRDGAY